MQAVAPTPTAAAMASGTQRQPLPEGHVPSNEMAGQGPKAGNHPEQTQSATRKLSPVGPGPLRESKLAVPATSTMILDRRIPLGNGLSSDSEGPLPEIDSGESSDEDDE